MIDPAFVALLLANAPPVEPDAAVALRRMFCEQDYSAAGAAVLADTEPRAEAVRLDAERAETSRALSAEIQAPEPNLDRIASLLRRHDQLIAEFQTLETERRIARLAALPRDDLHRYLRSMDPLRGRPDLSATGRFSNSCA